MISYNPRGDLIITGTLLPIHQLWDHYDKYEVVQDMLEGKVWGYYWKESTSKEQKVADFLKGSTVISGTVVRDYFKLKEFEDKFNKFDIIIDKVDRFDKKLENLSTIIHDLYITTLNLTKSLSANPFIGLKEISEAFKLNGKSLYTIRSLRNKVISEKFREMTVGHLDIENLRITLMKRGKFWVTPLAHWESERRKIDYDYLTKLRYKNKNVYDKTFTKKKSLSENKKENKTKKSLIKNEVYNAV